MKRRKSDSEPTTDYPSFADYHAKRRDFLKLLGVGAAALAAGCRPRIMGTMPAPETPPGEPPIPDGELPAPEPPVAGGIKAPEPPPPALDGDIAMPEPPARLRGAMVAPAPPSPADT